MQRPSPQSLVADVATQAAQSGLVLATDGRTTELFREPLPAGWFRVGVTMRGPIADALTTVPETYRGPEWDSAAAHLASMQARGVL